MPDPPSMRRLLQIAQKTLSRGEDDPHAISSHYLQALLQHLQRHPNEINFLVDLQDGGGTLTCLDCYSDVLLVNTEGHLKDFNAFWHHIATPEHKRSVSPVGHQRMDVDMDWDAGRPAASSSDTSNPYHLAKNSNHKRRVMKRVLLADGEIYEYSTEEEDVVQSHMQAPMDPSVDYTSHFSAPSFGSPFNASSEHMSGFSNSNDDMSSFNIPNNYMSPFNRSHSNTSSFKVSDDSGSHVTAPYNYTHVRSLSNSGSQRSSSGLNSYSANIPSSSFIANTSSFPTKRAHRGVRRHDFGDGDILYLSTDDENVDERPYTSSSKKPKLGGALIKTGNGIVQTTSSIPLMHAAGDTYHPVANDGFDLHSYRNQGSFQDPVPQLPSGLDPASIPSPFNLYHDPNLDFLSQPGPSGFRGQVNPGLGVRMDYYAQSPDLVGKMAGCVSLSSAAALNLSVDEDRSIGVGPPDPAQKDFFVSAMEDFQETPKVVDAARKLGLENTTALLPGLEVQLMPHQLIGVNWMVEQEANTNIRGGILADDMGLGKTVQCIAMCAKNPPPTGADRTSTLVVAPAALLEQWASEFRQRTKDGSFRVHIHHGRDKLRSTNEVRHYQVVITTYQTLCADFGKDKNENGKSFGGPFDDDSDRESLDVLGPLAATAWHRVVLDEAQYIRNRATRSSRCVARLDSMYRWALTGTPVTNTLTDIYALLRFLQFRPFNDWKEFNERIARVQTKNPDLAGQRAQALLKKCLLRRTKETKLEGKPILQLPPKHVEVIVVEFSPEEREIYTMIEERQKQKMSKFLKAGTVMKNYAAVLVMLLRLRQVCNHPQLIASDVNDEDGDQVVGRREGHGFPGLDTSHTGEVKRAERLLGTQFVEQARAKFLAQAQARIQAEAQDSGVELEDTDCPICFDTFVNNCRITSCKHLFCADCLNDLFKSPPNGLGAQDAAYINAMQTGIRSCPVCRGEIHPERVFKTSAFEPSTVELDALRSAIHGREIIDLTDDDVMPVPTDVKGKGKASAEDEADFQELDLESLDRGDNFEPSAKMVKMTALIKQWHATAPEDKIICYSQWTSMITLVEKLLHRDNIETVRYDGKMSRLSRDEAVTRFKKRSGPSIMLVSLKCGGVGLNLVEANRVLCLDLAWNAATESQAFGRVHRLGQQKEVHVKRLVVRNTVEERILDLQASKQSLADAALGEGKAKKIKKMTVGELKALFGM